ncbi:hypothetical protein V9T40_004263 [Parthenolecanium corni]|uniref:Ig-like domain-containing protein n=1 Tax=Parthenolecanium corni TaxID=536013 RepID=A0AAN9TRR5_9HEMI
MNVLCSSIVCAVVLASWQSSQAADSSCLSECSMKWKSGKRTAECFDRGMIAVPRPICSDTQVLDISGNDLQILQRDSFENGLSLQRMYIRSCRIGQIDKFAFRGLTNVIEIDLSDNLLTHIPSQAFDDVPYLRNISLARNPLVKVEAFAFHSVPQLQRLDLAYCNIQSIRPKAFDNLNALEYLKLHDNELQQLPTDTLESLQKLRSVELHNNKWVCDCHLRSVKVYLFEHMVNPPLHKIICSGGPERLRNLSLMELDAEDFACKPSIKTDVRNVEAIVGTNATLECRVESDPVATVTWYFGSKQMLSNDTVHDNGGQRLFIIESEDDVFDKRSKLVLTHVEESDAGEYHCVAENRAGHDEANFTLYSTTAASPLNVLSGSNINVITIALGCLIVFMLIVIVTLLKRIRYSSYDDSDDDDVKAKKQPEKTNSIDTSSQKSHDSEIKSESGKAFTVTSDLSYSRSLSDIGNPTFSNPDLISGAPNARDSACITPITRPISDYCHNWQRSYAMPASRAVSTSGFAYDLPHDRVPMVVDTISAGSGSDDVFSHSRMSDYPPDYGLPILPEHEVASQPCAKTLKVWQRGVPVYPPMCSAQGMGPMGPGMAPGMSPAMTPAMTPVGPPPPPNFQTLPHMRQSPAEHRYQRCGTDV